MWENDILYEPKTDYWLHREGHWGLLDCTHCHHHTENKNKTKHEDRHLIYYVNVCVCSHPGGLQVMDKCASGPINNSCCPDTALTINTARVRCWQGGVNG